MSNSAMSFDFLVRTVLCAATLAAASCYADEFTPQEKKLIDAARNEGAVTVINPIFSDETASQLGPAFIKHYGLGNDFKFNNLRKGTGQTVAQVRQEIRRVTLRWTYCS